MTTATNEQMILMNRKEVVAAVGLCYTSIYNLEKMGKFPARRRLGSKRVAWVSSEIQAWVDGLAYAVPVGVMEMPSPTENISEPRGLVPESPCTENPAATTRSRFEPWPWLS